MYAEWNNIRIYGKLLYIYVCVCDLQDQPTYINRGRNYT